MIACQRENIKNEENVPVVRGFELATFGVSKGNTPFVRNILQIPFNMK